MLWTDGCVSFSFGKGGSGVLANCSLYGTEATLSFSAGPVCLSFSAEACAILHALCWSRQHQQVCHFSSLLLSDSRSLLATLSSPPSFLLSQTLWLICQELSSLFSCSIRLQLVLIPFGVPAHRWLNISFVNSTADFIRLHTIRFDSTRIFNSFRDSVMKFSSAGVHKPLSHTSNFRMKF